ILDEDPALRRASLTSMRRYMLRQQDGRVFLGGRREGFQGELPGLMEEALLALEGGQPIYLAGGFGGITLDIARALKVDDGAWLPPSESSLEVPPSAEDHRRRLRLARSLSREGVRSGQADEENRRLAGSVGPGDIEALVSLGLGLRVDRER